MLYLSLLFSKHSQTQAHISDHGKDHDGHKKEDHKKEDHKTEDHKTEDHKTEDQIKEDHKTEDHKTEDQIKDHGKNNDRDKNFHNQPNKSDDKGHSPSQGQGPKQNHVQHHKKSDKDCDKGRKKNRKKKRSKRWLFPVVSFAGLFVVSKTRNFMTKRKKQQDSCHQCPHECP